MKNLAGEAVDPACVEICVRCGMVANVDPWTHTERYRHEPQVRRGGKVLIFDLHSGAFR